MRKLAIILGCVVSVVGSPSMAMDNTADDVAHLCNIAYGMCYAACKRNPDSVSGVIQQGYCEDDCDKAYSQCLATGGIDGPARTSGGRRHSLQNFANQAIFDAQ